MATIFLILIALWIAQEIIEEAYFMFHKRTEDTTNAGRYL